MALDKVTVGVLADNAVTSAKIADGTVVAADIGADAVGTTELANDVTISTSGNIATTGSGTLTVAGASTLTGNATASGNLTVTGDIVPSTPLSHRNFFINGGLDIWQRGTSLAGATKFLADRWFNGTTETQTRQTFTYGQTDVDGFPTYYHRGAGGSTEWYEFRQRIENVGILGGQTLTLSYWMKGDSGFTNAPYSGQNFGSGGSPSADVNTALATHSVTTSWARYSQTFTLPSISGKTIGTNGVHTSYTQISLVRANVNNIIIDVANCQLELGSNATPFEHRSYGDELARCQRYYYLHASNASSADVGVGGYFSSSQAFFNITFPCSMREAPTVVYVSGTNYYKLTSNSATDYFNDVQGGGSASTNEISLYNNTQVSGTAGYAGYIRTAHTGGSIAFKAEL